MNKNNIPSTSSLPLLRQVVFYFGDTSKSKSKSSSSSTTTAPGADHYRSTMDKLFACQTIWQFSARWRHYKEVYQQRPSQMSVNQNLYCFHQGVEPMWEDPVNKEGGRLTLCPGKNILDECFDWLLCSFVGGSLISYGMVGIVLSKRARADRIELWLDASAHSDILSNLRTKLIELLPPSVHDIIISSKYKKHYDKKN
ncbi:translation initiation factor eIF 4e-like domain-containing protein [Cunninghamella echinulata]|nr:translation initiation factor eIF 4e-like domain-containing protein [Cunninghamella echinulata]